MKPQLKIEAKCIAGHTFTMSLKDIRDAEATGAAMCPKCGNVAIVKKITVKN